MKYLYKYPQVAFPYDKLVNTSRQRGRNEFEYELLDTGVFEQNRYFDVFVDYAKESPEDLLIQISIHNRGPEPAELHVLPTLWFRNVWSWEADSDRPMLQQVPGGPAHSVAKAVDARLGDVYLYCEGNVPLLFTENETNTQRVFGVANRSPFVKDSINDFVVNGRHGAVNPEKHGTKTAAHYVVTVLPGECQILRLRLTRLSPAALADSNGAGAGPFGRRFDEVLEARRTEADEFYAGVIPASLDADNALIIRALLQYYTYYGNDFTVECPTGSGRQMNLYQVAEEISRRLANIFLKDKNSRRPVYGGTQKFQEDAHWRDCLQFFEYFHGDNGAGLGANHQTGWTGIIARALHLFASMTSEQALEGGKKAYFETQTKPVNAAAGIR